MIDIKEIRSSSENIIANLARRGRDYSSEINDLKDLDEKWRELLTKTERLKHEKNDVSKEIGILKKEGKQAEQLIAKMQGIASEIKSIDGSIKTIKEKIDSKLLIIPNPPDDDLESADKIIRQEGDIKEFGFEARTHWEIGETLKIIDFKTAAKLSGSRFTMLTGEGAELERALISFMLDVHKQKHGYYEIVPPYLVREETMTGTGQLPKFEEEMYITSPDRMCLIPTAEVPLANIHREEILSKEDLPKKYVAYTPCFRREAGSYGKDTSGLIRNHQFNKVELVNIVLPEESEKFHEQLLSESEEVLKQLGLTYRVLQLGSSDMGFSASKTYDLEVWMPGEKKWREVSSCSNCRDFQARRMETRYRSDSGTEYVHTLNSSGVAVGRIFAAVLENFQTEEINVTIPDILRKYFGGKDIIKRT